MKSNDLIDFMDSVSQEIEREYRRIQKRVKDDPGTAGDQGEENWASLLRDWLPPIFQIVTKGRILSEKGIASPQVDVIVLRPEYPKYLLDKKVYLAGGVLAAFECKVTLRSSHISNFIGNAVEIRKQIPTRNGTPYKELNSGILYGLLAHSHSWGKNNSKSIRNIEEKLREEDSLKIKHPSQMPDIICVANLATWSSVKTVFTGPHQITDWGTLSNIYGSNGSATSGYVCHSKEIRNQTDGFSSIGALITVLLNKLAWEYPSLRPLAKYFSRTDIQGSGIWRARNWESSIYSEEIRSKIEQGSFSYGKRWDEWSATFF